jgi:hypothetical protein
MTKLLNKALATQYFWFFSWGYFFSAGFFKLQKFNSWLFNENFQLSMI